MTVTEFNVIRSWNRLSKCFGIIFEHDTDVPGLADSLKQIDAFLFLCEKCSTFFLRKPFRNVRSTVGALDPCTAIGFSNVLKNLSLEAERLLAAETSFVVSLDLNHIISGQTDPYKGEEFVRGRPVDELTLRFKAGVIAALIAVLQIDAKVSDPVESIITILQARGHRVIHVRLAVQGMPIIMQFGWQSNRLRNAFEALGSDCQPTKQPAIMAHVRRGDIAIFPLPNGRFIAGWGRTHLSSQLRFAPEIIERPEDAIYPNYDFDIVIDLMKMVRRDEAALHTVIASDGFERGLARIVNASDALKLDSQQIAYIHDWAANEKKRIEIKCAEAGISRLIWGEAEHTFIDTAGEIANISILLFSSGAFSKTLFKYLNFRPGSCALGPVTPENYDYIISQIYQALRPSTKLERRSEKGH